MGGLGCEAGGWGGSWCNLIDLSEPSPSPRFLMKTLLQHIPVSQNCHSNYKPQFVAYYNTLLTQSGDIAYLSGKSQSFLFPRLMFHVAAGGN